jgi:hypothetical protein
MIGAVRVNDMFDIHCDSCDRRYLVGTRSIIAFDNTAEGPVARTRCPRGHLVVRYFRPDRAPAAGVAA